MVTKTKYLFITTYKGVRILYLGVQVSGLSAVVSYGVLIYEGVFFMSFSQVAVT